VWVFYIAGLYADRPELIVRATVVSGHYQFLRTQILQGKDITLAGTAKEKLAFNNISDRNNREA
jgi:hypothetical protein